MPDPGDKRISDLSPAASLEDADLLEIVQSGDNKKLTGADIKASINAGVVLKQTGYATPDTINDIIACLRAAGLCAAILFAFTVSVAATPTPTPTPIATFGDISRQLVLPAGQSVRRNAGNTAFEAFTPGGGGGGAFTDLTDVPGSYTGASLKAVRVKADETGLEFFATPTPTATATATPTPTATATPTPTPTATATPTATPDVSDTAYDATSWDGVTTIAPSKNAVRDKIESMSLSFIKSVSQSGSNVSLLNDDNPAAGVRYFYGTDVTGTKGWQPFITSGGGGGIENFTDLHDVPSTYSGASLKTVRVNSGETALEFYTPSAEDHSITFVVDGAGIVLGTGTKNPAKIPFGGTLQGWLLIAKPSGSVTIDIYRAADGAGLPTVSIIGAGTKPALSSAIENSSASFTSWTSTTLTAKDNLVINVDSATTVTYVALTLYYK